MTPGFDPLLDLKTVDFRAHPELYRVARGEQGVLSVEPYKQEILPHWRFRTPEIARVSADKIFEMYQNYKAANDFVGMDMARKFLQMGYTRARRYANHRGGQKYALGTRKVLPHEEDAIKAASALIFRAKWDLVRADIDYQRLVRQHRARYG